jgi:hypothetical protein
MEDIRIKLNGKGLNSGDYREFSVFVSNIPKKDREKQIKVFPLTDEWAIDFGGRSFKNRKYVFVENVDGIFEIVFTNNRRKFENFVNDRTDEENDFLDSLKK